MLCKEQNSIIKKIREKNIVNTFSDEERVIYNGFVNYFLYIAEDYSLLRDFGFRYGKLKHRKPSDSQTDQKLTSAAFTLANKYPVIILDCDSDIIRLIDFFNKDTENKKMFNIQEPIHEILLYSDFKRENNFELKISYLNREIVEK